MPSDNYQGYALLRSILKSGSEVDVAKAVAYSMRIKLYPLSQAASPPPTIFVDATDAVFDATIPYNLRLYQSLDRMVQYEPWLLRDKAMIDQLKSVGIEKGKPFKPDSKTKEILEDAAYEVHDWIDLRYETVFSLPYYEGTRWAVPILQEVMKGLATSFANPDSYPVEGRGLTYSYAFFSPKHPGSGQFYLMAIKDSEGRGFDGRDTYCLSVPASPPVKQYWSATAYDRATHSFIRSMEWLSRSSQTPNLVKNTDGSVDLYFGSKPPAGKESNWVPTDPNGQFEVIFRLYGPEKALFDKTWKLPDIQKV
jgi:hypothetical protein